MRTHSEGFANFHRTPGATNINGTFELNGRADLATITLAAPSGNDRDITIQLKDADGDNVIAPQSVELHVFVDAAGLDWATTGGSTGIVDNGGGAILPIVANKSFYARSTAAGVLDLRWTDTGSEVAFLGIGLPSGRVVISAALTI